ncbi:MAG: YhcH/YjgK/YiaL family protein [Verrucomicrobia bacterium]|nr:YhcH/YjgK/YiaL family protein [Verrucomicrobiota bacterium]
MVLDHLENAVRYVAMNKGFAKAFEFLNRPDLETLPVGKHEIEGNRIYAMVAREQGRRQADALLETHEKYIDIQYVLAGPDNMGWTPKLSCARPAGEYDPKTDLQFFKDEPAVWLSTQRGMFVIFFPQDAHMPSISSGQIHKIVVKIAVEPQ